MRPLLITAAGGVLVVVLAVTLAACGGSDGKSSSAATEALQEQSDLYEISLIERSFHEAISKKDADQLVGLFSAHATGTFGPGKTVSGKDQIRSAWLKSTAWKPETQWVSDHPAYKLKVTIDGDRGTLHFECHFVDVKTGKVAATTAGNADVAKVDGQWVITNFVGSTTALKI
jgi:hypothetical protein